MVIENHVAEQFTKCSDLLEGIVIDLLDEFEKKNQDIKWYTVTKTDQVFFCLFVCLLYVPSQQLWSLRDGQFT